MIALILDRSTAWAGLRFERDGVPVDLEAALAEGFAVSPDDAPCAMTLLRNFIETRDRESQ
jgi:hypothetical protein